MILTKKIESSAFYLGAFLLLLGVRLVVVHAYGSSTPFFDDWDMGAFVHRFADQALTLKDWYTPAYQHQMLFSKLINIGLFDLNQEQWDTLNLLVFNSVVWCLAPLFIIWFSRRHQETVNSSAVACFVILLWLLPVSIVSATWAIVTHFYFMISFLLVAYWGVSQQPSSGPWYVGMVALACSALTIGAGVFTAIPMLVIFGYRFVFEASTREASKRTLIALFVVLAFALSTTLLWGLAESSNEFYKAKTLEIFLSTLKNTLFWPLRENLLLGVVLLAPSLVLTILVMRKSIGWNPFVIFTLGLSAYMIMQSLGIAYARNDANGLNPAPRYFEFLLLSLVANFLALLCVIGHQRVAVWFKWLLFTAWVAVLYSAVPGQLAIHQDIANEELERRAHQTSTARSYVGVGDPAVLHGHSYFHIAFPRSPTRLAAWLDDYKSRNTLAVELQVPGRLKTQPGSVFDRNAAVQPNLDVINARYLGETTIGSFNLQRGAQNAQGEYESQPLFTARDYLMIPTLGFLGADGLSLELVEMGSGKVTPIVRDAAVENAEAWRANYVRAPEGRYRIRARDESSKLWFAFAAPRELGPVSYYVRLLIENRHVLWNIGALLLLLALGRPLVRTLARSSH